MRIRCRSVFIVSLSRLIMANFLEQSMSIITFYAVLLNFSAFASPFFIAPWITANGFTWSFAAQGIMTIVLGAGGMGVVHWIGPSLRQKQGMMPWVNSEFENS